MVTAIETQQTAESARIAKTVLLWHWSHPGATMARFIVFILLSLAGEAWAQIDCPSQLTPAETLICATPELLQLDQWLGTAYRSALTATSDQRALRAEQRMWLQKRDRCSR